MFWKSKMAERKNVLQIKDGGDLEECSRNQRWWEIQKSDIWKSKMAEICENMFWKSKIADIWENVLEIKDGGHLGECSGNQICRTLGKMFLKSEDGGCSGEFSEILPSVKDPHPY